MTRAVPVLDGAARHVLDRVAADPGAPIQLGITAPGGYGKTTLLRALERLYRVAGVPVTILDERPVREDAVVLVDDAHRLDGDRLGVLLRLARSPGVRLAVAYRPWPRPRPLTELTAVLREYGPLVALSPYGAEQVIQLLTGAGIPAEPRLVELLCAQAQGAPALLDRTIAALRGHRGELVEIPDAAIAWLRYDLEALEPDVQRYLLAAEAGVGLDLDLLGQLLDRDGDGVAETIAAARATGLVGTDGLPPPLVRRAVAVFSPVEYRVAVRRRLAELQLARGGSVVGLARALLGTGVADPGMAAAFEAAADEALSGEPALAAQMYAAGVAAGRPVATVATRWARAAALAGDLDAALRIADRVVAAQESPDRADGARTAAAALAHRGQLAHSAELYRWSGPGWAASFAAIGLIGTGDLTTGADLLDGPVPDGPPTLYAGAAALMARGVRESVTGTPTSALAPLVRATDLLAPAGRTAVLPDSPAALAALVALHTGELALAESLLARAMAAGTGGALMARRHRLLRAWVLMARGEPAEARRQLSAACPRGVTLEPRDWLFAVALDLGLARRDNDPARLHSTWSQAGEAILRHPIDLFMLLPLGEFTICAARLGDLDRMAPHLAEARTLLARLDDPPLWSAPLLWNGLHAAIVAEDPELAADQAAALRAAAKHGPRYAALAGAAECWLEVLAGTVDPATVDAAACGLQAIGMAPDGAALAAQAAVRTTDRKAMVVLLDRARVLQGKPARGRPPYPGAGPGGPVNAGADLTRLSERELEVASLVVAGLTYKQIGDRLFISPKTIEHHVARMRQRLGCESRADLLARLRGLVAETVT